MHDPDHLPFSENQWVIWDLRQVIVQSIAIQKSGMVYSQKWCVCGSLLLRGGVQLIKWGRIAVFQWGLMDNP